MHTESPVAHRSVFTRRHWRRESTLAAGPAQTPFPAKQWMR
jgi:hypothetical protein